MSDAKDPACARCHMPADLARQGCIREGSVLWHRGCWWTMVISEEPKLPTWERNMKIGGAQNDVENFHVAMGGGRKPPTVAIRNGQLRARLILEEAFETVAGILGGEKATDAINDAYNRFAEDVGCCSPNLPDAADGVIDLCYVALGTLVEFGIDAEPLWRAVQAANMAKAGGGKDAGGKFQKPPGWTPPDIDGELRKQGWDGK